VLVAVAQNERLKQQLEALEAELNQARAAAKGIAPPPPAAPTSLFSPVNVEELQKDKLELQNRLYNMQMDNDRLRREKQQLEIAAAAAAAAAAAPPPPPPPPPSSSVIPPPPPPPPGAYGAPPPPPPPPPDAAPPPPPPDYGPIPPPPPPPPMEPPKAAVASASPTIAAAARPAASSGAGAGAAASNPPALSLPAVDAAAPEHKVYRATRASMAEATGPLCRSVAHTLCGAGQGVRDRWIDGASVVNLTSALCCAVRWCGVV
jgi:hypothetical protein